MTDRAHEYVQAPKVADRIGWEFYVHGSQWVKVAAVKVNGPSVLIIGDDEVGYRVNYVDACKVRAPERLSEFGPDEPVDDQCDGADRPLPPLPGEDAVDGAAPEAHQLVNLLLDQAGIDSRRDELIALGRQRFVPLTPRSEAGPGRVGR